MTNVVKKHSISYSETDSDKSTPRILWLVVDNPLIMKQMVEHMPDVASLAFAFGYRPQLSRLCQVREIA
jgi:hypothetical protein